MTGIEYSAMNAICDIAKIKKNDPDYWTRLEHQYAGMAMQAIVTNCGSHDYASELDELLVTPCIEIAHALVEKLKEKEERKW